MSSPSPAGKRVCETKDIIRMLRAEAEFEGELGWIENFIDPAEMFEIISNNLADFSAGSTIEHEIHSDLDEILQTQAQDERRGHQILARNQHTMDSMKPLVVRTEAEVNRKLVGFGLSKGDLRILTLREKVVRLSNLVHPQVKNYIRVWIDPRPTTGLGEILQAKLPLNECLQEFSSMLKTSVDIYIAGSGIEQAKGGLWKYQLVSRDMKRVIKKSSVHLKTDEDYHRLVRKVKGDKRGTPVAVLTQEVVKCTTDEPARVPGAEVKEGVCEDLESDEAVWSDHEMDEPLDDDGNPFFDPYDPEVIEKVIAKYADKHRGWVE